jgi:hypothetical protein
MWRMGLLALLTAILLPTPWARGEDSLEADFIYLVKCGTVTGNVTVQSSDAEGKLQNRLNMLLNGATMKIVDVVHVSGNTYLFTMQVTGAHLNFTLPAPFQVTFNGPNNTTIVMPTFCVPGLQSVSGQATLVGNTITGTWATSCENGTMQGTLAPDPCAPRGGQGLGTGHYKNSQHFDDWHTWTQDDAFETVFGVDLPQSKTLLEALNSSGGGMNALLREAVAALLNANNPDINYLYTQQQVIEMVQGAFTSGDYNQVKDLFAAQNELGT